MLDAIAEEEASHDMRDICIDDNNNNNNNNNNNTQKGNNDSNTNTPIKQSFSQSIAGRFRGSSLFQGIRILSDTPEHIRIREGGPMAGRRRTVGARPTGKNIYLSCIFLIKFFIFNIRYLHNIFYFFLFFIFLLKFLFFF